jgi:hypothetical protein
MTPIELKPNLPLKMLHVGSGVENRKDLKRVWR